MEFWLIQNIHCLVAILIFTCCGFGFARVCFEKHMTEFPFWIFCAPLFGVMIVFLPTIIFYNCHLSLRVSALLSIALLSGFSLLQLFPCKKNLLPISFKSLFLVLLTSCLIVNFFGNYQAFTMHGPYALFHDGTDALGYANNADWLSDHLITPRATMSAKTFYDTLPSINLLGDQRLGSYLYLSFISQLLHLPALFSYQLAVTIFFLISALALSACVAKSFSVFALTGFALFSTSWWQNAFQGFLAKFLIIPMIFVVAILILRQVFSVSHEKKMGVLILLSIGITCIYPTSLAMSFFAALIAALVFYHLCCVNANNFEISLRQMILFGALIFLCFTATNGFSNLWTQNILTDPPNFAQHFHPWQLYFHIFSMKYLTRSTPYHSGRAYFDYTCLVLAMTLQLLLILYALHRKNRAAFVIMVAPLLLIAGLIFRHNGWGALQLSLLPYMAFILGSALLLESANLKQKIILGGTIAVIYLLHLPLIIFILHRDVLTPPAWATYSYEELLTLQKVIAGRPVLIATRGIFNSQPFFLIYGREHLPIYFTAQSWDLKNWGLALPPAPPHLSLKIIGRDAPLPKGFQRLTETKHYCLVALA